MNKITIREISKKIAKSMIVKNHYSHKWTSCRYALGIFYETGNEVSGEIIRILDKGIIIQLEMDVEGIIPFGKMSKKDRRNLASQYEVGANLSGIVMKVSPEDKKVILYKEELAGNVKRTSANDEVKQYLHNQNTDSGEKLELPQELIDLASQVEADLPSKKMEDVGTENEEEN